MKDLTTIGLVILAVGCTVEPLSSEGRPCAADGICGPGTRCDTVTWTCTVLGAAGDALPSDAWAPDGSRQQDLARDRWVPQPGDVEPPPPPHDTRPPPPIDLKQPSDSAPWPDIPPWPDAKPWPDLSVTPPTCTQIFGSSVGFILCQETATSCSFYTDVGTWWLGGTCNKVCNQFGKSCLASRLDVNNSCTWSNSVSCGYHHNDDAICVCSR